MDQIEHLAAGRLEWTRRGLGTIEEPINLRFNLRLLDNPIMGAGPFQKIAAPVDQAVRSHRDEHHRIERWRSRVENDGYTLWGPVFGFPGIVGVDVRCG